MIPAEMSDVKLGATLYKIAAESDSLVVEIKVRDRVMAERNKYGKAMGQDETLEEHRDFIEFIKNRVREGKMLKLKA